MELLDLGGSSFEAFPEIITELKSLKYLCIPSKALNKVPREVSYLENLDLLAINDFGKLALKGNKVYFPYAIGISGKFALDDLYKFDQIKSLDLSGLKDKEILDAIDFSRFENLKELGLFNCGLNSLPASIF